MDFSKLKSVHFIGVGGIGTSAVARMFLLEGKKVSGSDIAESEVTVAIREAGAKITIGQHIDHVPKDAELIINSIAFPELAPDLFKEEQKTGIPMLSYP